MKELISILQQEQKVFAKEFVFQDKVGKIQAVNVNPRVTSK